MKLLDYPAQLLPHMDPWEIKHYEARCKESSGLKYLHWLIRTSGRYTDFKLKSDYVAEKQASLVMHALACADVVIDAKAHSAMLHDMLESHADWRYGHGNWKMRVTLERRTRLLLVCK